MKKKEKREHLWPCQKCGECCLNIPIEIEFVNTRRDKFQRIVIEEIISPKEIGDSRFIFIRTSDGKCVFLDQHNECAIYYDRPKICRDYGRKPGGLECIHVTPSGRIRTPSESERVKKKINMLHKERAKITGNSDKELFGVHFTYDGEE